MKNNPVIPFVLIMVMGIALMFTLSFVGLNQEAATEEEGGSNGEQVAGTPEELYQSAGCINCHGGNQEGMGGFPALTGVGDKLSADEIKEILRNGKGSMPGGLVPEEQIDSMTEWLSSL
ncbi:cytochrome c [Bacillus sp. AGMB 02131]|uniref:Cytochrome c n=1 Tax=Peribacillus faecalis TaxID=2772559 RepID=A0A927CX59_9BACI|nr:cytochrome c [Peribacillus faecalis]MBD3107590.1 cytochrome c [Peribacillus faecalis]